MLIRLAIENFYSIRDRQELDLSIPRTTPDVNGRFFPIFDKEGIRVPSVVALYGPNASGKSTVLRAVGFLEKFITRSFEKIPAREKIPIKPFACREYQNGTTSFELDYAPSRISPAERLIYRYELKIKHADDGNHVAWEALRYSTNGRSFRTYFERTGDQEASSVKPFKDLGLSSSDPRLNVRTNVSFISSLVQFAHPVAEIIARDFNFIISNSTQLKPRYDRGATTIYSKNPELLTSLNDYIKRADLGIRRVFLDEKDGEFTAQFEHDGLDVSQTLDDESQGTRNFYGLFPIIMLALQYGGTAVVDEMDSDLHPLLMPEIVRWYTDGVSNEYGGQIIMSCHNATLLEVLEKEEVWFTEKDHTGATKVYPLKDISGIRRDANLYAKYLSGALGAVPQIG
jgi:hypothetical protein